MAFGLNLIEARKSAGVTAGQAPKLFPALFFISRKKPLASPGACAYNARVTSERLIKKRSRQLRFGELRHRTPRSEKLR
jgi:hypothetical protein